MPRKTVSSIVTVAGLVLEVEYNGDRDDFELETASIPGSPHELYGFVQVLHAEDKFVPMVRQALIDQGSL